MRWFFLSLLLSNAAYFAWQVWVAGPTESTPRTHVTTRPEHGLTLLEELSPEQKPLLRDATDSSKTEAPVVIDAATSTPAVLVSDTAAPDATGADAAKDEVIAAGEVKPSPVVSVVCFQSSETDSATELDGIAKALRAEGVAALQREHYRGERVSYWVMLAPYASREKADEAAKMLQGRKVRDFFIVRSGQYENGVSLGVYSSRERAQRRIDEIAALKLRLREPRIELRTSESERHLVRFSVHENDADMLLDKLKKRFPEISFTKNICK